MLKQKIGMMLIILGICTVESEWLVVPIALLALGAWLMRGLVEW